VAEAITEMIIPGTYIEVRAEGLIGVSGIATGNVGVAGTASKGPVGEAIVLSSFSEARETFGNYDGWKGGKPGDDELTLVRALQQIFSNGGSTVYAVRVAATDVAPAKLDLKDGTVTVATVSGVTPGTWANEITVEVKTAASAGFVEKETPTVVGSDLQISHPKIAASARNVVKLKSTTGKTTRLNLSAASGAPGAGKVFVDTTTGILTFPAGLPATGDTVVASYEVETASSREIEIVYKNLKETYTVVDAKDMVRDINSSSSLVRVDVAAGQEAKVPNNPSVATLLAGGSNGEGASDSNYKAGLAFFDSKPVNIVVLAGRSVAQGAAGLLAHVETAENNGRDRIAVIGADGDGVATVSANADTVSDDRLILVAPGIRTDDIALGVEVSLPAAYAAAAVAGLIASLAVHVSPTNKVLRVAGLTTDYSDGELKQLLGNRVMPLEKKAGYRIVKGITTDDGAFRQVSVRRIVDFAKAGTRIGSNPYIGKLNNTRVRGALKATLNGFLSDMVLNEALTEYTLDVTATREQEIVGVAVVIMYLKPTFSIDYIKVIMNLS
jgi:hypothetical protein